MPLIYYTGQLGKNPSRYQVTEIVFGKRALSAAAEVLRLAGVNQRLSLERREPEIEFYIPELTAEPHWTRTDLELPRNKTVVERRRPAPFLEALAVVLDHHDNTPGATHATIRGAHLDVIDASLRGSIRPDKVSPKSGLRYIQITRQEAAERAREYLPDLLVIAGARNVIRHFHHREARSLSAGVRPQIDAYATSASIQYPNAIPGLDSPFQVVCGPYSPDEITG